MGLPYVYCKTCGERTQQTVLYVRTHSSGSKRRKWEQIFRYCRRCSALSHVIRDEYSLKSEQFSATLLLWKEQKGLSIAVPKHLAGNVMEIFQNDSSLSVDEVSVRLRKAGTRTSDYAVAATLEALVGAGILTKQSVDRAEQAMENMRKNTSWYERCPRCRATGVSKLYARFGERGLASVGSVCVICGYPIVKRRNLLFSQGKGMLRGNPHSSKS